MRAPTHRHRGKAGGDKYIRPALQAAGWHGLDQIYREFPLRAGRVVVRGNQARRDASTVLRA